MRIMHEEKLNNGQWFLIYNEFSRVLEAVDYCADMNEKAGAYKYRPYITTDPAEIAMIEEAEREHEAEMESELEREARFGRELDAQFEEELREIYPRPDSIYDTPYHW